MSWGLTPDFRPFTPRFLHFGGSGWNPPLPGRQYRPMTSLHLLGPNLPGVLLFLGVVGFSVLTAVVALLADD